MTIHFNKKFTQPKRRYLRSHQTSAEKILWCYIRKKQIENERFLRQYSIDKFIIDFYCPNIKLGIELDGPDHYESAEKIKYDIERTKLLQKYGIIIIRFDDEEVLNNNESVIEKITKEVIKLKMRNPLSYPL